MTRNKWKQRCAAIRRLIPCWCKSDDGVVAVENCLAVIHQVVETWGYRKLQHFHSNTYDKRTRKYMFTHKSTHESLYQHYSQLSKCGNNPSADPSLVTPWTVAYQVPLSMGFSRQEYWSGLPFPSPSQIQWKQSHSQEVSLLYNVRLLFLVVSPNFIIS